MLRTVFSKAVSVTRSSQKTQLLKCLSVAAVQKKSYCAPVKVKYSDEDIDESELIKALKSKDITGWDIRSIVNITQAFDEIPNAKVLEAQMLACRQVNDYALAVRILESLKAKCGKRTEIYDALIEDLRPTLDKLGILTPEQMGYDKPELFLKNAFDIHN